MYLEHLLVQFGGQFGGADLTQHAQRQADQVVVGACQIHTDAVGGHHQ
jgi:hypothetical protein